jgi:plastocyanin
MVTFGFFTTKRWSTLARMKVSLVIALSFASLASLASLASVSCNKESEAKPTPAAPPPAAAKPAATRFEITVTDEGFKPDDLKVPAATPVTLVFTRKTDQTCAKEVVITLDGKKIQKVLPLNTPVEIAATFPTAGKVSYACGMDMMKATLTVQ